MFGSGNRTSLAGDYIIFYVVAAGGIEIIRVIHGARDIEAMSPF
jgi:plasmid stabilization system protein ParE